MNTKFQVKTRKYLSSTLRVLTLFTLVVNAVAFPIATVGAQSPAIKVGFVTDVGGLNDQSGWNALINQGLVRAENDLGIVGTRYEPTTEGDYELLLQQCVNNGNELCIASNFMLDKAIANIALVNPGTNFLIVDMPVDGTLPNLRGTQFDIKQVGYLAGALAGKLGSTMGVVGGMEIPPVTGFVEGFRNGAQCSNSDANVLVNYTGTFVDPVLGAGIAQDMIAQGANVIFGVGGQTGNGAILYSAQDGKWSIGVDMDQYLTVFDNGNVSGSYNMLTSAMKNLDFAVYQAIQDHISESFTSGTVTYDLEDGGVALAPYHETDARLTQSTKDYVNDVRAGIINGSIDVNETCRDETQPYYPGLAALIAQNHVLGFHWPEGAQVTLNIDDPDNGVGIDYSDTQTSISNPDDPWDPTSTQVGFSITGFTLQAGQIITMTDGTIIQEHTVTNLTFGGGDFETDSVWGRADAGAIIEIVHQTDHNIFRRVTTNQNGDWFADFSVAGDEPGEDNPYDIQPGDVMMILESNGGGHTQIDWHVVDENPMMTFFTAWNGIVTGRWPLDIPVQITVDDLDSSISPDFSETVFVPENPDEPGNTRLIYGFPENMIVQPGYTITLNNGQIIRTLVVSSLQITGVDLETDIVSGTVEPYAEVTVIAENSGAERHVAADAGGNWNVDFKIPGNDGGNTEILHDIVPGDSFRAMVGDEDGDITFAEWQVAWPPRFGIQVGNLTPSIHSGGFLPDSTLTATVDNLETLEYPDYTTTATTDMDGLAIFQLYYNVQPGDTVTLTDGVNIQSLVVRYLIITSVNADADTISGNTDPFIKVRLWSPNDQNMPMMTVVSDTNGNWTANYSGIYDLTPGLDGFVETGIEDEYGENTVEDHDNTMTQWRIPNPTFGVRANTDQIEGWEWQLDTTVTITIDDPGTPLAPDITKTADVYEAPWNPDEHRFDLDLRGEFDIQPGFVVTVTDGNIIKQHTVLDLYFTSVNVNADIVYGKGKPDSPVNVWTCNDSECINREEFADSDGDWSSNFAVPGDQGWENQTANLRFGSWIDSSVYDDDGDSTEFGENYEPTGFAVVPYDPISDPRNIIVGWDWEVGTTVDLCIEDPPFDDECEYTDSQTVPSEPNGFAGYQFEFMVDPSSFQIAGGQRVTLSNGTSTTQHIVTNLHILDVDWDAGTVSGTAEPGQEVTVPAAGDEQYVVRWVIPDDEGNWSVNFAQPGEDADEQNTLDLHLGHVFFIPEQRDGNGNSTKLWWQPPNPIIEASSTGNWVHARGWPLDTQIALNISGSSDTYTATIGPAPWDWNDIVADFDLQGYDVQPGDTITATGNGTTKTLTVSDLRITSYDLDADTISGVATPGMQVEICVNFPDHCANRQVTADEVSGEWTVNYADPGTDDLETVDLEPGSNGWAAEEDANFNRTWYDWRVPNPNFAVRVNANWVEANEWTLGSSLTLEIDDPGNGPGVDYTDTQIVEEASWDSSQTYVEIQFEGLYGVQPGDIVTLTDGVTFRTHIVTSIEITGYDLDSDLVYGVADPDSHDLLVYACGNEYCSTRHVDSDSTGNWMADFGNPGILDDEQDTYDIVGGTWLDSQQGDEDGDFTFNGLGIPNPTFDARLTENQVHGYEWPLGSEVTLSIDGNEIGTQTVTEADWDPSQTFVWFDLGESLTLHAGQFIEVTDGNTTKTHIVTGLDIAGIDPDADTIFGTADPGSLIYVGISPDNPGRNEIADASGHWIADYSTPGNEDWENNTYNIQPGDSGEARQCDEDWDCTQFEWHLLSYTLHAVPSHPEVHGHDWTPGSDVTLIIDDDTNPDNGTLYTRTKNVDDDPWCGNPCFDLNGVFDLQVGQYTTMTDGEVSKTVQVSVLTITEVDYVNDILRGEADPGSRVAVNIWSQDGLARYVTTEPGGTWEADFSVFGDEDFEQFTTDIIPGDFGRAIQLNPDGSDDGTLEYWTAGSTFSGTVYLIETTPENGIGGVLVEACTPDNFCRTTLTDGAGNYWLAGLRAGSYTLRAMPPGTNLPGTLGPIDVSYDEDLVGLDIIVSEPPSPPPSPDAVEPAHSGGGTVAVFWQDNLTLTAYGCTDGTASFELTVLDDGYTINGEMAETYEGSGVYKASIPPLHPHHGATEIVYTITCPDSGTETTDFFIYIDPSGVVIDTNGMPVENATVTLLFAVISDGPFTEVSDGDVMMSPSNRTNPDLTDENGAFGWDVTAGYYKVRVEKAGCVSPDDPTQFFVESDVLTIPPPVTDLALVLECRPTPTDVVITAPVDPVQVGQTITATATFDDPDGDDIYSALWDWGDGSTDDEILATLPTVSAFHTYTSTGVYTITVTITDSTRGSSTATFQYVVIYDPDGGYVTGGGWIDSPEGAFYADPLLTGKATFGFVSKYKKGANVPAGNTEFQFKVADLNFKSTSYDWLVVAGARAQFKGIGMINGAGEYGFMLTAIDGQINGGGVDKFRIKIWDVETGVIVYDNMLDADDAANPTTEIQGGSIVIHKAK